MNARTVIPMRAPQSASAIVGDIALTHGYHLDALRGWSQEAGVCRARARAMKALKERGWSIRKIGKFFGDRSPGTVHGILKDLKTRQESVRSYTEHPDHVFEVEAQVRRITGVNLAHQVAHELAVPTWQAIFLSILMESYPLVKTAEQIMEAYEEATARLYQEAPGAMDSQIRTFSYHIRKRFTEMGLPDPVTAVRPRGFVLTYEAAVYLHNRFGRPVSIGVRASA